MSEDLVSRIRPGARVECSDGYLGTVDSGLVAADASGYPALSVAVGWSDQTVLVPMDRVRDVDSQGTIWLTCSRAETEGTRDRSIPTWGAAEVGLSGEPGGERTVELREEELVARKQMRQLGEIVVRTVPEEVPGRLEIEAFREEVEVEHEPVGQFVERQREPWHEDGVLVMPVYEEQLVVVKRLVHRENLRVRRVRTSETRLIEEPLRRERLVVEDPENTGMVREIHAPTPDREASESPAPERRSIFDKLLG